MALASQARAGYLPCMIVTRASRMNNAHRPAATRRLRVAASAVVLLMLAMVACTSGGEGDDTPARDASQALELNVMEFNIEYGGNNVDASVIEAIQAADADVVAIEEAYGKMPRLAAELGWPYYDAGLQLVSRFPLLAPPESDGLYTFVAVRPGRVVAVANVHLPSTRYGPFQIERNDAKPEEVMEIERNLRLPALEPTLDAVSALAAQGMPVFLAGDFNAPSHLDWTQETVGLRDHVRFPLDWPVSVAVEQAGLLDSYREMHPDPVEDEGLTWPAARRGKGYNPARNGAAADRIDFVYAGGPAKTTGSVLVGEPGGAGVDIEIPEWPTDHRATVSTFDVTPADPPAFVAVQQRLVEVGDDARVTYHAPDGNAGSVVVVPEGDAPGAGDVAEQPAEGARTDGTPAFSTAGWDPGSYEAVLLSSSGDELARIPFWVQGVGVGPEIDTVQPTYEEGRPIDVEWHAAPGNRFDWIGIYKRGADPKVAYYIMWNYTEAAVEGSATFDDDAHGPWPLKPGAYSVYLLQDDSYKLLAGGDFTVRG
jgi:endonuclease/exonuclease/phosphatase (EEP) superfamily protein YafD